MKYKDSQHTELSLKRLPINYMSSHAHAATYSLELYGLTLLTSQPIEQGVIHAEVMRTVGVACLCTCDNARC